jgi:hypothetical protein
VLLLRTAVNRQLLKHLMLVVATQSTFVVAVVWSTQVGRGLTTHSTVEVGGRCFDEVHQGDVFVLLLLPVGHHSEGRVLGRMACDERLLWTLGEPLKYPLLVYS